MAKPVKFYYDFLSQPCRALYMFLEASKIPYEPIPIELKKGEHLTDTFKRNINRFQQVPVINDNGFKLTESVAIFRYLAREKLVPYHWYPKESQQQARIDEYLEWQHTNTRLACTTYFQTMWLDPIVKGEQSDKEKIKDAKLLLETTLDNLENNWIIRPNHFLVGDKITIADLLAASEIEQTRITGYDPCQGRPKISKWLKSVQFAMEPYYDEAHSVLNKYANRLVNTKENIAAKN